MKRLALALVLFGATPALADSAVNDCQPNTPSGGCSCDDEPFHYCDRPDMSFPPVRDMGQLDFSRPVDEGLDARRERRRRRNAAGGRGLILLSGASALVVFALRRRYRTMRPTPAESALAASETRSDS